MIKKTVRDDHYPQRRAQGRFAFLKGVFVLKCLVAALLALNLTLLYAMFFSSKGVLAYRQQRLQVKELEARILKLKKENQRLYERIQGFKNDRQGQERMVRQELGWIGQDEIVLEFVPPPKDGPKH